AGLDGYNWGSSQPSGWQSFRGIFAADYAKMTALTSKPIIIGETSSSENGGSKAPWITQTLLTDLPQSFPQIKGLLWFNENKEQDWLVNSSPAALAAIQQTAASPLYQGRLS